MTQFLIFGTLLAVIPVAFFSLFSYINVSSRIDENISMTNRNLLRLIQENIEEDLKLVDQSLYELSILPSTLDALRSSVTRYNWTTFDNINSLRRKMDELQYTAERRELTVKLVLINELGHWVIDDRGFFQRTTPRVQNSLNIADVALYSQYVSITRMESKLIYDDHYIYLVRGIYSPEGQHYGTVMVSIEKDGLFRQLEQFEDTENVLILDARNQLVASHLTENAGLPVQKLLADCDWQLSHEESFRSGWEGESWSVSVAPSDYLDWKYVKAMRFNPLSDERLLFSVLVATIALSVLAVAIFAVFAFSRAVYRPISTLIHTMRPANEEPGTGGDEFEIISRYMASAAESRRLLEGMLEEQREQIRGLFFQNLLEGRLSAAQIESRAPQLGLCTSCKWYCVSVCRIENFAESEFERVDADLAMFAVKNIAEELISRQAVLYTGIHQNNLVVIHHSDCAGREEALGRISEAMRRLLETVSQSLRIRLGCGVSNLYTCLHDTSGAYANACDALKYRVRNEENAVGFYDEIRPEDQEFYLFPQQALAGLLDALRESDPAKARVHLHNYIDSLFRQAVPYTEFQFAVCKLVMQAGDCLRERLGPGVHIPELSQLLELGYSAEVESWIVQQLLEPALARAGQQPLSLAEQVAQIVQEEYETPLTLEYCASRVGYHPSYVSRVFRAQMGLSFKEYLYLYRINKAKQLLVSTDMKLQDISNRLCYNNPQNFIRIFKKVEGITPGEYRARYGAPPQLP